MTKRELIDLLKDNNSDEKHNISASAFVNIGQFARINLNIDKKSLDYFYEINLDELVKSQLPNEEYEVIKNQGWFIEDDKLKIYLI